VIRHDAEPHNTHGNSADAARQQDAARATTVIHEITPLALAKLANQRRVYDRLDWWPLEAWRTSDALIAVGDAAPNRSQVAPQAASLSAALLIVPMSVKDMDLAETIHLHHSASPVAWLRWCAVAEVQSPSARLAQVLGEVAVRCRRVGITELWCLSEPQGWLGLNLRDLGFKRRDELITLSLSLTPLRQAELPVQPLAGVLLRVLQPSQLDQPMLDALQTLDFAAFASPWHYSKHVLRQALSEARYVAVAEIDGRIVGYQCSILNDDGRGLASLSAYGHVTRLAVHPTVQHRGIGHWLFADALHQLVRLGATEVTLNTLSSNTIAQKFYRHFGFVPLSDRMAVLSSEL